MNNEKPVTGSAAATAEVVGWAQAMLTGLNVGDVQSGSKLHLKLREVMIAYRASIPEPPSATPMADLCLAALEEEHKAVSLDRDRLAAKCVAVCEMVQRYLVASKGRVSESWLRAFEECGAVSIDRNYPTGFIKATP